MRNSDYIKLYADLFRLVEEFSQSTMLDIEEIEKKFYNTLKDVFETYYDENM